MSKTASALSIALLALTACSATPEQKVQRLEEQRAEQRTASGYDECMRKVRADEQKIRDCVAAKLAAEGYTDGQECFAPREGVCTTARTNAEINARNTCPSEVQFETELNEGDCALLIGQ